MVQLFGIISENVIVGYLRYALGKSIMIIVGICSIVSNYTECNGNILISDYMFSIEVRYIFDVPNILTFPSNHG